MGIWLAAALAALQGESRFAGEVGKEEGRAVDGPAGPLALRFDFSRPGAVEYAYRQRIEVETDLTRLSPQVGPVEQSVEVEARLEIASEGGGRGTLVLKDGRAKAAMRPKGGPRGEPMEQRMPPLAMKLGEDGRPEGGAGAPPDLAQLFPLPPEPLAAGESASVPLEVPYGAGKAAKGRRTITLKGWVEIDGRRYVRVDSVLEADAEDCRARGRSSFLYDAEAKAFRSGALALRLRWTSASGYMDQDSLIRLSR